MCLNTGFSLASRKLSVEIGGAKRLYAISSAVSAALLLPAVICLYLVYELSSIPITSFGASFFAIAIIMFVLDYYVDSVCIQRLEPNYFSRYSTLSLVVSAFAVHFYLNSWFLSTVNANSIPEEHQLSAGLIFSSVMFIAAVCMLSVPIATGSKGKFVGYSTAGLPLYTFSGESLHKTSQSVLLGIKNALKQVLDESDSRKIFYFLCINIVFTFVEMAYGIWTNSLGLLSDSFHMMFDCSALVMGLYAAIMSRWKPTPTFSYGFGRVEVLSGFINGLFLVVIAFFVFTEALNRLFDPPEVKTERLLIVSVAGLLVNLTGIFAFHHGHSHREGHHHSHQHQRSSVQAHSHVHGHSHGGHNANMQGVFLHILADTLGSVGVIVSSLLIENVGWLIADPICSLFISSLIFLSVLPLLKDSAAILVLKIPSKHQKDVSELLKKLLAMDGVVSYRNQHFWLHSSSQLAGSIHIQVRNDISEQKVLSQISTLFVDLDFTYFTIQIEKENYFLYLSGLNSKTISRLTNNPIYPNLSTITHVIKAI
uniref:Proton-coupled zinc antiporter SLC30A5 n=1 Tax=Strigamia maritima TaxID=126957 RepID=T1J8P6_STRMM